MTEEKTEGPTSLLKRSAPWIATLGLIIGGFSALGLIIYAFAFSPDAFPNLLDVQVRAVVGIPMAAVSAFCVVWVLEATSGKIEFEALGFKFRGASGPVVLWIMAFLSFVLAIYLLWITPV